MNVRVHSARDSGKGKNYSAESSNIEIAYSIGDFRISLNEREHTTGERGGDHISTHRHATVVLTSKDMRKLLAKVCEARPNLIPGYQKLLEARTSLATALSELNPPPPVHVVAAKYRTGFRVWLQFSDGLKGEVDLESSLGAPKVEALKDIEFFKTVQYDAEVHNITWDTDAVFTCKSLHKLLVSQTAVH